LTIGNQLILPDDTGAINRVTTGGWRYAVFAIAWSFAIAATRGGSGISAGGSDSDSRGHGCLSHGRPPRLLMTLALAFFRLHVVITANSLCDDFVL